MKRGAGRRRQTPFYWFPRWLDGEAIEKTKALQNEYSGLPPRSANDSGGTPSGS
jgi:hypothetical protein